jgi:AraC-like DNA-binding protein
MKGVSVQRKNWTLQVLENRTESVHIEILGKYTTPVLLEYKGQLREISVIFKPLGINRFFKDNYFSLAPHFSQELVNDVWRKFGETLFFGDDPDFSTIDKALMLIENSDEKMAISTIASEVGLNAKTFQRYFQKHMGCSPIEYRRIFRFRSSLTNKLNSAEWKNLTDITYEGGYYDQSYFIKEFRKITHHNPKDFFKSTSKVDGDKIIWEIK